jgi:hypothetical protein
MRLASTKYSLWALFDPNCQERFPIGKLAEIATKLSMTL